MAYGFDEFNAHLKFQLGKRPDLEDVDGTNMYDLWINTAYKWLTTRNRFWKVRMNFYFPEMEGIDSSKSTSDGVAYVSVPDNTLFVREVFNTTSKQGLDWMSSKAYLQCTDRADTNAEGPPREWTTIGDNSGGKYLYFHPTPDTTYSLELLRRRWPAALTGTNTTQIGEEWDEAILLLGAHIGHDWMGEAEEAERKKASFIDYCGSIIGVYRHEEKAAHATYGMNPSARRYEY